MRRLYLAATAAALFFAAAGVTLAGPNIGPKPTSCPTFWCGPTGQ